MQEKNLKDVFIDNTLNIEDYKEGIHCDFANEYIGGGVLSFGNVQEEIMFSIKPECLVSIIICEKMLDNEAIFLENCLQYSQYKGYGETFKFIKPNEIDVQNIKYNAVAAIDAIPFFDSVEQYENQKIIDREIIKSLSGFQGSDKNYKCDVITGNWGCGVFRGDPQLKFMIQWISCSYLDKKMVYCTFKDERIKDRRLQFVYNKYKGQSIQKLYLKLIQYKKWEFYMIQDMLNYLLQTN